MTGLIDASDGSVLERYEYTPYGERRVLLADFADHATDTVEGSYDNRLGFQGLSHDFATGLIHQRTRPWHSTLGRFMTWDWAGYPDGYNALAGYHVLWRGVDPIGLALGDSIAYSPDINNTPEGYFMMMHGHDFDLPPRMTHAEAKAAAMEDIKHDFVSQGGYETSFDSDCDVTADDIVTYHSPRTGKATEIAVKNIESLGRRPITVRNPITGVWFSEHWFSITALKYEHKVYHASGWDLCTSWEPCIDEEHTHAFDVEVRAVSGLVKYLLAGEVSEPVHTFENSEFGLPGTVNKFGGTAPLTPMTSSPVHNRHLPPPPPVAPVQTAR